MLLLRERLLSLASLLYEERLRRLREFPWPWQGLTEWLPIIINPQIP